jgi:hypothetical protein
MNLEAIRGDLTARDYSPASRNAAVDERSLSTTTSVNFDQSRQGNDSTLLQALASVRMARTNAAVALSSAIFAQQVDVLKTWYSISASQNRWITG